MADITRECDDRTTTGSTVSIPALPKKLKEWLSERLGDVRQGDHVYLLTEYRVGGVLFEPVLVDGEDTEENTRVQTLAATGVTQLSAQVAKRLLDTERERIRVKLEEDLGIGHLSGTVPAVDGDPGPVGASTSSGWPVDPEEKAGRAHRNGEHDGGLVDGCPYCEDERAAEMAETGV